VRKRHTITTHWLPLEEFASNIIRITGHWQKERNPKTAA
jgi:hypothetical protein